MKASKTKFNKKQVEEALEQAGGSKLLTAQILNCSRPTLDKYLNDYKDLEILRKELIEGHIDEIENKAFELAKAGNVSMIMFLLKNQAKSRGYVEGKQEVVRKEVDNKALEVIENLKNGEITPSTAALEFTALGLEVPDSVRMLLQKEILEPVDPTNGLFASVTEEEMLAKARKRQEEINKQIEGIPIKEREIQDLKDELKENDSFNSESIKKEVKNGET